MSDVAKPLLLVDDDPVFCEVVSTALARSGFDVRTATDSASARREAKRSPPDYALIDLRIGDESGLKLVEWIVGRFPDCKVVMLTGFGSIETAVLAVQLGARHYLTKPTTTDKIIAAFDGPDPADAAPPAQPMSVRRLEWEHIQRVLAEHDGNISATARALGMHRRTLQRKLQKYPARK